MAEATKLREKEATVYASEKADSNASIAALGKSIAAIEEETAEVEPEEQNSQGACEDIQLWERRLDVTRRRYCQLTKIFLKAVKTELLTW